MNVYLPVRLGIVDMMACHFHRRPSCRLLAQMLSGFRDGTFDRVGVLPIDTDSAGYNQAGLELFTSLGVPVRDSREVVGWVDVRSLPVPDPAPEPTPLSVRPPSVAVPLRYILFCQHAGNADRCLDSPAIFGALKHCGLQVVKVGHAMAQRDGTDVAPIPCDVDLTGMTTLPQLAWLAKHAACVVAPLSMHRNWTWAFGTPVIELAQENRISAETIERTNKEYREKQYGMGPLNHWLTWPVHREQLRGLLEWHCGHRKTFDEVAGPPWIPPGTELRPGTLDRHTWLEVYRDNPYTIPDDLSGKTVVDIGANVGAFSALCLGRGAKRLVAYEAMPQNMATLLANLARFGARAEAHNLAVWRSDAAPSTLRVGEYPAVNTGAANVLAPSGAEVGTIGLDAIATELGWIDLLKIDAEGSEYAILMTAKELGRVGLIVGEFHGDAELPALVRHLQSAGFSVNHTDGPLGLFWAART